MLASFTIRFWKTISATPFFTMLTLFNWPMSPNSSCRGAQTKMSGTPHGKQDQKGEGVTMGMRRGGDGGGRRRTLEWRALGR